MKSLKFLAVALASVVMTAAAAAQPVGIGVSKGGAVNQMGSIISKVVSEHAGVQMRTQPMGGVQQYTAAINAGQLEFGMLSSMQFAMNYFGTHVSDGDKKQALRVVASLVPFTSGLLVTEDSGIKTAADLKGKRVAWGFSGAPLMDFYTKGILANGGLTGDDINQVLCISLRQGFELLKTGKVDAAPAALGAAHVKEIGAALGKPVRFVAVDPGPQAMERTHKLVPRTVALTIKPSPNLEGIPAPTPLLSYYYMLVTNEKTPAAMVTKVVDALAKHESELKESSPVWRLYQTKLMPMDHDLPYHDAAVAYYKNNKMWDRK